MNMSAVKLGWTMAAVILVAGALAQPAQPARPAAAVSHETVAQLLADINAMAVINLLDMTPEQMAALAQIIRGYDTLVRQPPPEVIPGLEKVKANLVAGEGEDDAWYDAGVQQAAIDYDSQLAAARDQAIAAALAMLNDDQKDVLASRGTPYEMHRRLVWEVGHCRDLDDAHIQAWGDKVVADLSQPLAQGAPGLMTADQATDLIRRVRRMDNVRWGQTALQLRASFARSLPTNVRRFLDDPQQIQARMTRQITGFINDGRLPAMLDFAARSDQTTQPAPAGGGQAAPEGGGDAAQQ
jgi:hypothetical protein